MLSLNKRHVTHMFRSAFVHEILTNIIITHNAQISKSYFNLRSRSVISMKTNHTEYRLLFVSIDGSRKDGNVLFNDTLNIFYL